jgi:hypothetical protein
LTLLPTLLACGSEREQSMALLDRLNAIDVSALPDARMPQLVALESLRLRDDSLRALQALCASAHRALIESEVEQAKARHALDTVGADETPAQRAHRGKLVAMSIERSTSRLRQARDEFPECERQTRSLSLRFPRSSP